VGRVVSWKSRIKKRGINKKRRERGSKDMSE
jgi:hypothetical protein